MTPPPAGLEKWPRDPQWLSPPAGASFSQMASRLVGLVPRRWRSTSVAEHAGGGARRARSRKCGVAARRSVLPSGGSALALFGRTAPVCEALEREVRGEALALVVASSNLTLRSVLQNPALRSTNVVGAVDRLAFASDEMAHVVVADVSERLEVVTFDSRHGALPEFGRTRLEGALDRRRAPHFVVFAGEARRDDGGATRPRGEGGAPGAVLDAFRRRVEGLFGDESSCSGVVARSDDGPAKVVHARRRRAPGAENG